MFPVKILWEQLIVEVHCFACCCYWSIMLHVWLELWRTTSHMFFVNIHSCGDRIELEHQSTSLEEKEFWSWGFLHALWAELLLITAFSLSSLAPFPGTSSQKVRATQQTGGSHRNNEEHYTHMTTPRLSAPQSFSLTNTIVYYAATERRDWWIRSSKYCFSWQHCLEWICIEIASFPWITRRK